MSHNNYFNPPSDVPKLGRRLERGSYPELLAQLSVDEVLIGLYWNQVPVLVATHLESGERMTEMENAWAPADGYYALRVERANKGLDSTL